MKSLAYINNYELSFDLKNEFLTEFSSTKNPQYFQLWKNKTIIRSASLKALPERNLIRTDIPLNSYKIYNVILPDGRSGKSIVCHFIAQHKKHSNKAFIPFK